MNDGDIAGGVVIYNHKSTYGIRKEIFKRLVVNIIRIHLKSKLVLKGTVFPRISAGSIKMAFVC